MMKILWTLSVNSWKGKNVSDEKNAIWLTQKA